LCHDARPKEYAPFNLGVHANASNYRLPTPSI
jgi:hypothetical protein